jgi:NADPH:quinone reductase
MRAVQVERFGGPEVLEVAEVSSPEPQADEILLEVEASGVNRADLLTAPAYTIAPGTHRWCRASRVAAWCAR